MFAHFGRQVPKTFRRDAFGRHRPIGPNGVGLVGLLCGAALVFGTVLLGGDGRPAFGQTTTARSVEHYNRLLLLDPERADFYLGRAQAWEAKGDRDHLHDVRALADYDAALWFEPKSVAALTGRALLHERHDRLTEAMRDWDALADLDPTDVRVRKRRALLLVRASEFELAIPDLDAALRFDDPAKPDPNLAYLYAARGDAHYGKQDYDKAKKDYDTVLGFGRYLYLRIERPELRFQSDDLRSRLAEADQRVKQAPQDPKARSTRGQIRYMSGDFAGAVDDLDVGIVPDKEASLLTALRGLARLHLYRDEEAATDFEAAVKLLAAEKPTGYFKDPLEFELFIDLATADIKRRRGTRPAAGVGSEARTELLRLRR